jgi:hypothetical protein
VREEVADQAEPLVGHVRRGRQAQVDERERRRGIEGAQQRDGVGARGAGAHVVVGSQREGERVGDQRIVVHDQQRGLGVSGAHGCTA